MKWITGLLYKQRAGNGNSCKYGRNSDQFLYNFAVGHNLDSAWCGVMPAGQGSTRNLTVSGFTLPVAMAYSSAIDALARVPGIATSEAGAKGFVERLVKQTVGRNSEYPDSQTRTALLPDAVISAILSQLTVTVTYTPLMCSNVRFGVEDPEGLNMGESACIIVDGTVTSFALK
ncbi:hypothetical protein KIN20_007491 [Parelaphostrongylus tenuis]|uniref:Uncharacterized protein n=1 Tax=Parelaphostrongylus tenuis TaxID=148309 RepID=A0AAD5MP77_PARTN|nr:hypothetical protein KIN20_007491 [Parelaphostrongylus tenuis]